MKYETAPLESLANRKIGYGIVQPGESIKGGIPVIKVNNIISGLKDKAQLDTTTEENDKQYSRTRLNGGELIVSVVGTIGRTAIVPDSFKGCNLVRAIAMIDIPDPEMAWWVKYYIDSQQGQSYIFNNLNTTVQPTLNIKSLSQMPIPIPDKSIIKKIVSVLQALDKKIELNAQVNDNLQQQAQVLFEHLYDNCSSRELVSLADLMDYAGGSQPPASEFIFEEKIGYVRFVQIRDYDTDGHITYIPESPHNKLCEEHDIMIARYGASLGRICFGINGAYNVALAKVFPKKSYYREFLRCYLSSRVFYEGINNKGGRSAQAGFNQSDIKSFELRIPSDAELMRFEKIASSMFEQRLTLNKTNRKLSSLRDGLLPKLMSGEIDVSNITL